ncbi:hypothetical protein NC651_027739 [Populus alba x Populus x berolinensis]|nr:hypothetical protein NC651_027739 [Populus alba x Populus x berolinensis]
MCVRVKMSLYLFLCPLSFFLFLFPNETKRNENPPLPCTWAEQPASAAILVLVLVLALLPSIGNAIASTRICLSHVGNAICQQQPSHHLPLLHNHSRFSSNKSKFGNLVKYETPEGDLINSRSLNALRKYASLIARKIQRN